MMKLLDRYKIRGFAHSAHGPIGLDLGTRAIKAVQLKRTAQGPEVCTIATLPVTATNEPLREVARRVREVLDRQDFQGRQLVLAAPPRRLESDLLDLPPRSSGAPIDVLARGELSRSAAMGNDSFELATWDLPTCGRAGTTTAVMAVALRNVDADELLDAFAAERLNVVAIDTASWACARAIGSVKSETGMTAVLDLGWDAARLALLARDAVVYQRVLTDVGIGTLHQRIGTALDVEADVVQYVLSTLEQADCSIDPGEAARLRSLINHHAAAIATELKTSLAFASHRYPDFGIDRLVIGGGGAMVPGMIHAIESRLRIQAVVWKASLAARTHSTLESRAEDPSLMVATGLALYEESA